jgi:hypothetical protein
MIKKEGYFPSFIYIYCEELEEYKMEEISNYLKEILPRVNIEIRKSLFSYILKERDNTNNLNLLAEQLALCHIYNLYQTKNNFILPAEVAYEKRKLLGKSKTKGIIYNGFLFQSICADLIPEGEHTLKFCHIVFTNQLVATFDMSDKRYHLRVGIYGFPNVISTSGLIEALAKPREYYLKIQLGINPLVVKEEFKGDILDKKDNRIPEILKGYCLQAIFYHIEGEAFCDDKNCRLYNAHWHREAIQAQINSDYELCEKHSKIVTSWRSIG